VPVPAYTYRFCLNGLAGYRDTGKASQLGIRIASLGMRRLIVSICSGRYKTPSFTHSSLMSIRQLDFAIDNG
jgi:hypothetical protein